MFSSLYLVDYSSYEVFFTLYRLHFPLFTVLLSLYDVGISLYHVHLSLYWVLLTLYEVLPTLSAVVLTLYAVNTSLYYVLLTFNASNMYSLKDHSLIEKRKEQSMADIRHYLWLQFTFNSRSLKASLHICKPLKYTSAFKYNLFFSAGLYMLWKSIYLPKCKGEKMLLTAFICNLKLQKCRI